MVLFQTSYVIDDAESNITYTGSPEALVHYSGSFTIGATFQNGTTANVTDAPCYNKTL